ncbi:PilN domain-containing protein [Candidatus Daviesbacteria bacterium]|nr:PilN domain-containing protein [Candidatus Daviesbacteria bacterium]
MPKKSAGLINLDLLKPQSEPQKLFIQALRWILSSGRFLIVFVEILVLAAFVARFKLDADILATKEAIEEQIPFIESLKSDEDLIRRTQFQIATIYSIKQDSPDYHLILQKIAAQTPTGVTIRSLSLQKQTGKIEIKISGTTSSNANLTGFLTGLKKETFFQDINLTSTSFEQNVITFSITGAAKEKAENL